MPLAFNALGLAILYAGLAWWLLRKDSFRLLAQSYALLAVGFATLAVPLALSAAATACVFALEGAGLLWLGLRQQRRLPQFTGIALQLAAAAAFVLSAPVLRSVQTLVANPAFMSALLIALAGFASAWCYRRQRANTAALLLYLWGVAWWLGNGISEIDAFAKVQDRADFVLMLVALTGWLAAEIHRLRPASALSVTTLVALAAAALIAPLQAQAHVQPFAGLGAIAWAIYALLGVRSLWCLRSSEDRIAGAAQFVWWLVWPFTLSLLFSWLCQRFELQDGWYLAAIALPWLLVCAVSLFRWRWLCVPLGERFDALRLAFEQVVFCVLGLWWLYCLLQPGNSAPLSWVPVLNPLELASLAVIVLLACWLWSARATEWMRSIRTITLAIAGFIFITAVVLRTIHHWGALPWDDSLISSSLAQTSLTVVWSVLGVLGWVIGSRRGQRLLWLAGAVLMGVVLAKLVLVDRNNLGNVLGIASFMAYGLLCTVVGYLAPAPPRAATKESGG